MMKEPKVRPPNQIYEKFTHSKIGRPCAAVHPKKIDREQNENFTVRFFRTFTWFIRGSGLIWTNIEGALAS